MRKYDGKLIYRTRDDDGDIEVVEDTLYRSLHFGTDAKQSSMLLRDPLHLALSYTRAMSSALLFTDTPKRALLVGLGGGSLAKFLVHHFPGCHIDIVESRRAVVDVAISHFQLPQQAGLHFHIGDGGSFIRGADRSEYCDYDLIFIDAFLGNGIARSVCGISFFDACSEIMSPNGVFSMNLWNGDFITAREMLEDIRHTFAGNALHLPVDGKDNTVALAGRSAGMKKRLKRLRDRAEQLGERTGVEYPALLKQLKKHNSWLPF